MTRRVSTLSALAVLAVCSAAFIWSLRRYVDFVDSRCVLRPDVSHHGLLALTGAVLVVDVAMTAALCWDSAAARRAGRRAPAPAALGVPEHQFRTLAANTVSGYTPMSQRPDPADADPGLDRRYFAAPNCLICWSTMERSGAASGTGESGRAAWRCPGCGSTRLFGPVESGLTPADRAY